MRDFTKYKGKEKECIENYKDTFQKYNDNVSGFVNRLFQTLTPLVQQKERLTVEHSRLTNELIQKRNEIVKKENEIRETEDSKTISFNKYIERVKQGLIDNAYIHSESEMKQLQSQIDEARILANSDTCNVCKEYLAEQIIYESKDIKDCRDASLGVLNYIGTHFGRVEKINEWSTQFKELFESVKKRLNGNKLVMNQVAQEYEDNSAKIKQEFAGQYKKNPYTILTIIQFLYIAPIAVMRLLNPGVSISESFSLLFNALFNRKNAIAITTTVIWFIEFIFFLLLKTPYKLVFLTFGIALYIAYRISKKNVIEYSEKIITAYLYYDAIIEGINRSIDERYEVELLEYRQKKQAEFMELEGKLSDWVQDNEREKARVAKEFDPNSLDKSEIENECAKLVKGLSEDIKILNETVSKLSVRLKEISAKLDLTTRNYEDLKEAVAWYIYKPYYTNKDWYKEKYANIKEHLDILTDDDDFDYITDYAEVYSLFNTDHIVMPLRNGHFESKYIDRIRMMSNEERQNVAFMINSKLPLNTIPIKMTVVDLDYEAGAVDVDGEVPQQVVDDIKNILNRVANSPFDGETLRGDLNDEYKDSSIDFTQIYKVTLATHNYKCSLVMYNSDRDKNYESTILNLIRNNMYKSALCSTEPKQVAFNFLTPVKGEFNKYHMANTGSQDAVSSVKSNDVYVVWEKGDAVDCYKKLDNEGQIRQAKVANDGKDSFLEYTVAKNNIGSDPETFTYLFVWVHELGDMISDSLIDIVRTAGGGQSKGSEKSGDNTSGILPIIIFNKATLNGKSGNDIDKLETLIDAINYDNFFNIGASADTLVKANRNEIKSELAQIKSKSRI